MNWILIDALCILALIGGPQPWLPGSRPLEKACRIVQAQAVTFKVNTDSTSWEPVLVSWHNYTDMVLARQAQGQTQLLASPEAGADSVFVWLALGSWQLREGGFAAHLLGTVRIATDTERRRWGRELYNLLLAEGIRCEE